MISKISSKFRRSAMLLLVLVSHHGGAITRRHSSFAFNSLAKAGSRNDSLFASKKLCSTQNSCSSSIRGGATILGLSSDSENSEEDFPEPRTGWDHNTPDDRSNFWKTQKPNGAPPPNGEPRPNRRAQSSGMRTGGSTTNERGDELPTGWLHNTEPTPKAKEMRKEQKKQTSKARARLQQAMKDQERNHRMIFPPAFHACGAGRTVMVTEHLMSVPLYRNIPRSPRIDICFTVIEELEDKSAYQDLVSLKPTERAKEYVQRAQLSNADDMILYLQGGPGMGSPTPVTSLGFTEGSSWAASALKQYSRVVLMDQRGTGRSTALTTQGLKRKFPDLFLLDGVDTTKFQSLEELRSSHSTEAEKVAKAVEETVEYMAQFRADSIVQDAEEVRDVLLLPTESDEPRPWGCALGQSFGGFCIMTYLSQVASPPRICMFTGGIAPILTPTYDLYSTLWGRVKERSLLYYEMYPGDIPLVKAIVQKLLQEPVKLPSGGFLTARRFLQLGLALGGSPSSFASLHALFATAFVDPTDPESDFTTNFLRAVQAEQPFDEHPVFFWLHESIYADGPEKSPTNWAAHRAYEDLAKIDNSYDYKHTSSLKDDDSQPTLFFGEMMFPWMSEDHEELSGIGMQEVANSLATKKDWGKLYDKDHMRQVLGDGTCRAAAAVYHGDMFVDFDACMEACSRGGPLEHCKVWVTNDYQHSGLRDAGAMIFSKLYGMATGCIRTPS